MFSEMFLANDWPRAADEEIERQANRTIEKEKEMREKKYDSDMYIYIVSDSFFLPPFLLLPLTVSPSPVPSYYPPVFAHPVET